MRETKFTEIDGASYECEMMPATLANRTLIRLIEVLGRPAVVGIAGGFGGEPVEKVVEMTSMILTQGLTPDSADEICMAVLQGVHTGGREGEELKGNGELNNRTNYDNHFAGRIATMYKVVAWSIQVNYADFFAGARSNQSLKTLSGRAVKVFTALIATLESGTSSSPETTSTSKTSTYSTPS